MPDPFLPPVGKGTPAELVRRSPKRKRDLDPRATGLNPERDTRVKKQKTGHGKGDFGGLFQTPADADPPTRLAGPAPAGTAHASLPEIGENKFDFAGILQGTEERKAARRSKLSLVLKKTGRSLNRTTAAAPAPRQGKMSWASMLRQGSAPTVGATPRPPGASADLPNGNGTIKGHVVTTFHIPSQNSNLDVTSDPETSQDPFLARPSTPGSEGFPDYDHGAADPLAPQELDRNPEPNPDKLEGGAEEHKDSKEPETVLGVAARDLQAKPKGPPPRVLSADERMAKRVIQIRKGMETKGYQNYSALVPKCHRKRWMPTTPDPTRPKYIVMSKRKWEGYYRVWRRALHEWDDGMPNLQLPHNKCLRGGREWRSFYRDRKPPLVRTHPGGRWGEGPGPPAGEGRWSTGPGRERDRSPDLDGRSRKHYGRTARDRSPPRRPPPPPGRGPPPTAWPTLEQIARSPSRARSAPTPSRHGEPRPAGSSTSIGGGEPPGAKSGPHRSRLGQWGDWICPSCEHRNWGDLSKRTCDRCHRPTRAEEGDTVLPTADGPPRGPAPPQMAEASTQTSQDVATQTGPDVKEEEEEIPPPPPGPPPRSQARDASCQTPRHGRWLPSEVSVPATD